MSEKQGLGRGISILAFYALGIGCVFGSAWLVLTGSWLTAAGGPSNALLAVIICIIMEIPFALAYLEATPMIPLSGGEISYSYLAFGSFIAFIAGWFGVLAMIALCAWESLALTRIAGYLIPSIKTAAPLYQVGGSTITAPLIIIGLVLIGVVGFMGYRGVKLSAKFQTVVCLFNVGIVIIAALILAPHFRMANLHPLIVKPVFTGVITILCLLPFSIGGWEAIAKGAEEASSGISKAQVGTSVFMSLIIGGLLYALVVFVPSAIVPWQTLLKGDIPFATASTLVTGSQVLAIVMLVACCCGVLSVYNAAFYASTRLLYALGRDGLIPPAFATLHPKYKTPTVAVIFVCVLAAIAPFVGKSGLIPLIDVCSFCEVSLWVCTLVSVMRLRKTQPQLNRPVKMPAIGILGPIGILVYLGMVVALLYPASPGALVWPVEDLLLIGLIVLGVILYYARPKAMTEQQESELILGDIKRLTAQQQPEQSPEDITQVINA
jgi:amino acid transporter